MAEPCIHGGKKKECKMCQQYAMGEVIGEGSQGKVREALDSRTLRRVAIKIVNLRQLRKFRNAEAGLRRELSIHRRLKHPYVVEMIERCRVGDGKIFGAAPGSFLKSKK